MVIYRMVIFRKSVLNDYIKIMKVHHAFFLLLAIFLLGGCSYEQVISDVDQKQANEIVASLGSHGISSIAQTERSSKGKYTVEVDKGNYALAVTLLHELGLPKEATPSFRDLTEQKGFLPNSREIESARLDYALGVEIEEKLKSVGGIDSVKVLVRSNLIKGGVEPSASVIISSSISTSLDPKQITDLIALMVPGLTPQRIAVWIHNVDSKSVAIGNEGIDNQNGVVVNRMLVPFLKYFKVADGDAKPLAGAFLLVMVLAGLLCFIFGYAYGGKVSTDRFSQSLTGGPQLSKLSSDRVAGRIRIDSGQIKTDSLGE